MSKQRYMAAIHVLTGMAANLFGRTPLPRIAHYCPTWTCNQNCLGCTVSEKQGGEELSADDAVGLFRELPFLDVVKIVGGEPFARTDLARIAKGIIYHVDPYILQVVTNGTMVDRILDFANEVGSSRLHLRVSLSGIGATHDEHSEVGSYDKAHETLTRLADLRRRKGISLGINYRLSDRTADDLAEARRIYAAIGVDIIPGVHYSPFLTDTDIETAEFKADIKDPAAILKAMESVPTERGNMSLLERALLGRFSHRTFQSELMQGATKRRFGCRELRNLMYLLPSGDLIMCGLRQRPLVNLVREDFQTAWFSKKMDEHRAEIDRCPGCPQAAIEIFSRLYLGPFRKRIVRRSGR